MKFNEAVKVLLKFDSVIESVKEMYGDDISKQILKDLDDDCFQLDNYKGLKDSVNNLIIDGSCDIDYYQGDWDYYTTITLYQFMDYEFYYVIYGDSEVEDYYLTENEGYQAFEDLIEWKKSCEEDLD